MRTHARVLPELPIHRPCLGEDEVAAVARVFDSRWLGMGAVTREFESALRTYLGARHVLAVSSGTAALHLALAALDLAPAAEVVVPSLTFVSTVQAILAAGARPVFCEVRPDTLDIDVADALSRATPRCKVILPVHYAGVCCDMETLLPLARQRQLTVVEDAAHAFGSSCNGRKVGTLGEITCFSFDPVKNITCAGGGAVVTDSDDIAKRIILRRNVGIDVDSWSRIGEERSWYYEVVTPGYRYHLPDLNAAIGLEQLKRAAIFQARKRQLVERYDAALADLPGVQLLRRNLDHTFPFSYVVRVLDARRDGLMRHLRENGVGSAVQFIPNHMQPLFKASRSSLPVTEQLYQEILTLPLYVEMADSDSERVVAAIRSFFH